MSIRTILIGLLAVMAGLAAAIVVLQMAGPRSASPKTVTVVVAKTDIPRGQMVQPTAVTTQDWPEGLAAEGALATTAQAVGRATLVPQVKGQPVFESSLAPPGVKGGLAVLVPEGMRAFTILTPTQSAGVAWFIQPGNKVDVLLTTCGVQSTNESYTLTLLQNVEIMAVDQELDTPAPDKTDAQRQRSVTLLVSPEQAAKLSLAQQKGVLHLSLRNPHDQRAVDVAQISMAHLRFLPDWANGPSPPPPAEAPPEKPPQTRAPLTPPPHPLLSIFTLRGSTRGQVLVRAGNWPGPEPGLATKDRIASP